MTIIFGWNHFRIKTFDPVDLGLSQQTDPNLKIEVRQHYFHLFRIPFFSLGKKWAIRKNNELYEMPVSLKSTIHQRDDIRVRTPWYTYAGILLIAIVCFGFMANEQYRSYTWKQQESQQFASEYAASIGMFRKPSPDDYYLLASANGYSQKYAKVTRLDKQHIELSYITNRAAHAYKPLEIAELFVQYAAELQSVTISRGDSAMLFCQDYDQRESFAGLVLNDRQGQSYRVKKIIRLDGPVLKAGHFRSYLGSEEMTMSIENEGYDTEITRIEPVAGNIQWLSEGLPARVTANYEFTLRGRGDFNQPYKVKITCTNAAGKEIQYLLEGKNYDSKLTRL